MNSFFISQEPLELVKLALYADKLGQYIIKLLHKSNGEIRHSDLEHIKRWSYFDLIVRLHALTDMGLLGSRFVTTKDGLGQERIFYRK